MSGIILTEGLILSNALSGKDPFHQLLTIIDRTSHSKGGVFFLSESADLGAVGVRGMHPQR